MGRKDKNKVLAHEESETLTAILKDRFEKNISRHAGIEWDQVKARLLDNKEKLWSLNEMESSGGEPDVIGKDDKSGEYIFFDCSEESPKGRRSLCYDRAALEGRKENKPAGNIMDMAADMGVNVLTESEYRYLQELGAFDLKTSSWVSTPGDIRRRGGALFCDRRYNTVFLYHNGAESYYAARGFRASLKV